MRILIANDDGVYSPGICALAQCAQEFGEVRVVAPDVEMSSASHSITASRPLSYKRTPIKSIEAYRVNGTPGDCVALGAYHWEKVDVVLSGINLGPNLGNGLWHSGTLAAAKQAVLFGMRGFAFSTPVGEEEPDWEMIKRWAHKALEMLLPDRRLTLVNVNFPVGEPKGMRWTRQSVKQYRRQSGARQGSLRPRALLVHRDSDRGDRGGHRPVGGRPRLCVDDAAQTGPHEREGACRGAHAASDCVTRVRVAYGTV